MNVKVFIIAMRCNEKLLEIIEMIVLNMCSELRLKQKNLIIKIGTKRERMLLFTK